jgi:hypothetical protein
VREASGIDICAAAGRKDAVLVADPTLLFEKADYFSKFSHEMSNDNPIKPYALLYFDTVEMNAPWRQIKALCINKGLETKFIAFDQYKTTSLPFGEFYDFTIPDWIRAIDNAAAIFTNSFHGTIFSLLTHRPFIVFLRGGLSQASNDRIASLMVLLGLESRIYNGENNNLEAQLHAPIDWSDVDKRLNELRERSVAFLQNSLVR